MMHKSHNRIYHYHRNIIIIIIYLYEYNNHHHHHFKYIILFIFIYFLILSLHYYQCGRTALIEASWSGHAEIVRTLLEYEAEVGAKNEVRIMLGIK